MTEGHNFCSGLGNPAGLPFKKALLELLGKQCKTINQYLFTQALAAAFCYWAKVD
jgi:hypothetical protein